MKYEFQTNQEIIMKRHSEYIIIQQFKQIFMCCRVNATKKKYLVKGNNS